MPLAKETAFRHSPGRPAGNAEIVFRTDASVCQEAHPGGVHRSQRQLAQAPSAHASGAVVVADHFHVLKDANRRVDEAWLVEQSVSGHRIPRLPLVKNEEDLTERQANQLAAIRKHFRNVAHFHWVKEQLRDIYRASSREEAKAILERVLLETEGASDAALVQWGRTLRRWKEEILAYHDWRVTNGYTEGVHMKIKMLKRISFGFRIRDVYVRKVLSAFIPCGLAGRLITLLDFEPDTS
ncbi:MAG: hypothetical protein BAA00_16470 [Parageobacillus thermoglucosidasius]|nr:MAG: hypothetical protein BAA00_16470 [Parageobacillus thermoglucosidasius]